MATVTETTTATAQLRQLTFTDIFGRGQFHFLTFACVGCSLGFADFLVLVLTSDIVFLRYTFKYGSVCPEPQSYIIRLNDGSFYGEPARPLMLTKECI